MAYFDYLDNEKATVLRDTRLMDTWGRMAAWFSLGGMIAFLITVVLFCVLDIQVYFWFCAFNIVGIGLNITGIVLDSKTLKTAKVKKVQSLVGNMALALNILWLLLNITVAAIAITLAII